MNKTISLAVIGMFAVIMGMSSFAPAEAGIKPPGEDEEPPDAKTTICHKGKTITINDDDVQEHIDEHGDTRGPCQA